jgi:hypothetical protein
MERVLILGGREIVIGALGQPIDRAFDRLHEAYLGNTSLAWDEFTSAALEYFDHNPNPPAAHDAFFNNFTIVWRFLADSGRLDEAEHIWERALEPAYEWEKTHPGQHLHKGTPYYFWAMTALSRGDIDRGYLLAHQSVEEDVRSSGQAKPDTPGFALVTLNYGKVDQAFRQWVIDQAAFLNNAIANYNAEHARALRVEDIKPRFFDVTPDLDTVFLFTYTLARLIKIGLSKRITKNGFAGQLEVNLLFDLTLVIDSAIKAKNTGQWQFINHSAYLLKASGHTLTVQQLRDINDQFQTNFDKTTMSALVGTLSVGTSVLDRMHCDVALAYGIRNRGAHNVQTASTIWQHFPAITVSLLRVLFSTIDHLY